MEEYSSFRMPFELSNVAYLYLFISTFPPIIVRHDMNSCFHTYYLSTNHSRYSCSTPGPEPLGQRQRQRHKLKHQPIHYQGSSCDNHKVNVCIQFVCTNEFSPLQIRMTFICEIIHNNFFLLSGRPIFTFSILYSGAKQKKNNNNNETKFCANATLSWRARMPPAKKRHRSFAASRAPGCVCRRPRPISKSLCFYCVSFARISGIRLPYE